MKQKLKVLLTFDAASPIGDHGSYEEVLSSPERSAEYDIYQALKSLGHEIRLFAVTDNVETLIQELNSNKPDIVFNQAEQFNGDATQEKNIISFLEMLGVPYTGTSSMGLMLCKNKGVTKKILTHHRIKTANFQILPRGRRITLSNRLQYPLIIKPLQEEASYGISLNSFVENDKSFVERVEFLHQSFNQDVIAEEYIEGRELYVGILGNKRLLSLPPRELIFGEMPDKEPKIATYKAKWDNKYRERWGIENCFANHLSPEVMEKIDKIAKKVFHILYMHSYARLDIRLTPKQEIVIIEANPNPHIAANEDFALAAQKAGIPYMSLIQKILQHGLS